MNNKLLLLSKKHTDMMIEQTKSRPQKTLEFKMNQQMQTFSLNPPNNLVEKGKWLLAVTSFETTKSVFNITNENNSFSVSIPGRWRIPNSLEDGVINRLKDFLELREQDDLKLHEEKVSKRGKKLQERRKNIIYLILVLKKIIEVLKNIKYSDLEDIVFRLELSYTEILNKLDMKYIDASITRYTSPPGVYKVSDNNFMIKSLPQDDEKINITIDDIRMRSNLTKNNTIRFTGKSFSYTTLRFTRTHSGPLGDIEYFVQLIPGRCKSDKRIDIKGVDKFPLKSDCVNGSIINGIREPILFSFGSTSPPGHKNTKNQRLIFLKE